MRSVTAVAIGANLCFLLIGANMRPNSLISGAINAAAAGSVTVSLAVCVDGGAAAS